MDIETRLDMMCMTCLIEFPEKSVITVVLKCCGHEKISSMLVKAHGQSWMPRHPAIYDKRPKDFSDM